MVDVMTVSEDRRSFCFVLIWNQF